MMTTDYALFAKRIIENHLRFKKFIKLSPNVVATSVPASAINDEFLSKFNYQQRFVSINKSRYTALLDFRNPDKVLITIFK